MWEHFATFFAWYLGEVNSFRSLNLSWSWLDAKFDRTSDALSGLKIGGSVAPSNFSVLFRADKKRCHPPKTYLVLPLVYTGRTWKVLQLSLVRDIRLSTKNRQQSTTYIFMILIKISEWATFYLFNQLQKISPRIYFLSKSIFSCDQIYIYIYI